MVPIRAIIGFVLLKAPHPSTLADPLDMIELVEFLFELSLSWRVYLLWAGTAGAIWIICSAIPNQTIALALAVPIGIVGCVGAILWQNDLDNMSSPVTKSRRR